jgi:hypothetical protein
MRRSSRSLRKISERPERIGSTCNGEMQMARTAESLDLLHSASVGTGIRNTTSMMLLTERYPAGLLSVLAKCSPIYLSVSQALCEYDTGFYSF